MAEEVSIDSQSLEIIKRKKKEKVIKEKNGGPMRKGLIQRGF